MTWPNVGHGRLGLAQQACQLAQFSERASASCQRRFRASLSLSDVWLLKSLVWMTFWSIMTLQEKRTCRCESEMARYTLAPEACMPRPT